jgi:lipopolysaccharide/colanic/teichoic acid biosynthesis glycosyltransferase
MKTPGSNDRSIKGILHQSSKSLRHTTAEGDHTFYTKSHFHNLLRIERKRTERSKKPFLLMLLDLSDLHKRDHPDYYEIIQSILFSCSRETDIRGWYEDNTIMGIIFTEITSIDESSVEIIFRKLHGRIIGAIDAEWVKMIKVSFHVFPEENGTSMINSGLFNIALYPDLSKPSISKQATSSMKKLMDVMISACALLVFTPMFLIISAAVKLTSEGPVFFKQERMGLNGKTFTFLKFRSMYTNSDNKRHKDYIKKFISEGKDSGNAPGEYKIRNDPRITPIGNILRKTSIDELPQFINVLMGDMSLVGPRPPIPYEFELYDIWHKRRLLSVKPGITGLWQVTGRSTTTFDDMVRLDLKYINEWSLWLDIKLLLKTPWVIITGKGAY